MANSRAAHEGSSSLTTPPALARPPRCAGASREKRPPRRALGSRRRHEDQPGDHRTEPCLRRGRQHPGPQAGSSIRISLRWPEWIYTYQMTERSVSQHAAPVLVVKTPGSDQTLQAGSSYRIGRDPQSDIVVTDSRVSWHHAVLQLDRNAWIFEDFGSTNGTFMGSRKVTRVEISSDCVLDR